MRAWLAAFLFTQLVEVPLYTYAMRGRPLVAFGASALTHPIVWFVIPRLWHGGYWQVIALCEAFAIVVEGIYLRWARLENPFAWSVIANVISASLGLASRHLWNWP